MKQQLQKLSVCLITLFVLFSIQLKAQISPSLATQLQQILNNRIQTGDKGVSASVIMANGDTWSGTAGVGQNSVSITDTTVFHGASITKANVAVLILLLAENNLLHLDSAWKKYINLNVSFNPTITIRQLLNHTSGIKDYLETASSGTLITSNFTHSFTPQEILENIVDQTPLAAPGAGFSYATSNYALLALIAHTVTGNPVQQELRTRIWGPLGMTHTYFGGFENYAEPKAGVWWDFGAGLQNYSNQPLTSMLTFGYGGANIVSTPQDLAKFARALFTGTLLTAASFNQMETFAPGSNPFWNGYGLGVHRIYSGTANTLGHDGYYTNMSDMFHTYDYGFTLVTMSNTQKQIFAIYNPMYNAIKNHILTGVDEYKISDATKIYPIPAKEQFSIKLNSLNRKINFSLYDYQGKLVRSTFVSDTDLLQVDAQDLPSGIYMIKIQTDNGFSSKKLVITK